ncbi:hypothetical protein K1719_002416 [Acacia pycnantha]|nr:hypothetical protein K1719_002416 [Acacia pycnantha]
MCSFDIELRMAPRRVPGANTSTIDKFLTWTAKMDNTLIDAFMHELEIGNKVKRTFTYTAYDNISQYLSTVFGFKVDKEKVKNRWKTLKKKFSEMYDIFESGTSGFSWNSSTCKWEAEDQVWNQLIEVKPKAALWRNMPLPNYEKMLALYGNDRAYGDDGETPSPSNMKKRQHPNLQELADTVNVVGQLVSQNEVTFENFAVNLENFPHDDHSLGENSESSKRAKNSAATKVPLQLSQIAEKMDVIAALLREGIQVFRERYAPQISGEETLRLIRGCGCDERKILDIYCFLMNDATKLRTVIQCPLLLRKQVIMKMVFGS